MKNIRRLLMLLIIVSFMCSHSFAQSNLVTGLKYKLSKPLNDTSKAYTLDSISMCYLFYENKSDSSFYYLNQYVNFAFNLSDKKYLILAYARLGFYYLNTSQYNAGLNICFKGLQLAEQYHINDYLSTLYYDVSFIYYNLRDSALSMQNALKGVDNFKYNKDPFYDIPLHLYGHISSIYADYDNKNALQYLHLLDSVVTGSKELAARDISYYYWTNFYLDYNDYPKADSVIDLGIISCKKNGDFLIKSFYLFKTTSFFNQHKYEETIAAARLAEDITDVQGESTALRYLQGSYYRLGKIDSAYYYLKKSDSIRSVVQDQGNINETQQIQFDQQIQKKEDQSNDILQSEKNRSKFISYFFITALLFFLIFAFVQWRNNLQKKKANNLLQTEKQKVEETLHELKSTQSQLIQSEKMASLGELTAGIAHEIQNPLNFVNNFSEVNKELLEELRDEANNGNMDEVKAITNDLIENEEKINHHGKRADAIVKGMLQHSRETKGVKEPTDINALCDEFLRLSYHGLRAKDKSFNADFSTDFEQGIGKINIVPQDFGRVILNLFNNAFYAVKQKKKTAGESYKPLVSIATKKINNKIEITVKDNGGGIPQKMAGKIFQPFFTTKPAGEGTGLGLSLSYDIIKYHEGEIKVESNENEGTVFIISLPV